MRSSRIPCQLERNQPLLLKVLKDQKARLEGASARENELYPRCNSPCIKGRGAGITLPGETWSMMMMMSRAMANITSTTHSLLLDSCLISVSLLHEPLTKTKCSSL